MLMRRPQSIPRCRFLDLTRNLSYPDVSKSRRCLAQGLLSVSSAVNSASGLEDRVGLRAAGPACARPLTLTHTLRTTTMKTVAGMFETRSEAEDAIRRLQAAGFGRDAIGVAMRDTADSSSLAADTGSNDLAAEGATAGVISGAAVGALVGVALVGSTILLPGLGTVLIGGPLAAGLTGAGIGAASGGLVGGLVGAGIPEDEAAEYPSQAA